MRRPPRSTLFLYTTLFRSRMRRHVIDVAGARNRGAEELRARFRPLRRHRRLGRMHVQVTGTGMVHVLRKHAFRSEEHTSELQSHVNLVCRLLLEKKKKIKL